VKQNNSCSVFLTKFWIYINIIQPEYNTALCFCSCSPNRTWTVSFEIYTSHTIRHTHKLSRSPLNEWSTRPRGRYLHKKHKKPISVTSIGFETTISAMKRLHTYVLDRRSTGMGKTQLGVTNMFIIVIISTTVCANSYFCTEVLTFWEMAPVMLEKQIQQF
jgi:hypothetical protein